MASRKTDAREHDALRARPDRARSRAGRLGARTALLRAYFRAPGGSHGVIRGLRCDAAGTADGVLAWSPAVV